jgi:hypothetical protein
MHPLDHPVWNALTSRQRALAEGVSLARRYPPAIAPFAAMTDMSAQSFAALGALMTASDQAVLFTPEPVTAPAEFKVLLAARRANDRDTCRNRGRTADIVTLGPMTLSDGGTDKLTKPGPFTLRTHELGTFLASGSMGSWWRWRASE